MRTRKLLLSSLAGASALTLLLSCNVTAKDSIVYDAEFQKLQAQHGPAWAEEDKQLNKRLADLQAKTGKKPNIIYFMWDDAAYGRVGHPMLSKLTGIDTPNIDRMAREGMTLTRMYTEPSCTPTRVATMTGRHPIRSGTTKVVWGMLYGLTQWEITVAEMLSEAGYATPDGDTIPFVFGEGESQIHNTFVHHRAGFLRLFLSVIDCVLGRRERCVDLVIR